MSAGAGPMRRRTVAAIDSAANGLTPVAAKAGTVPGENTSEGGPARCPSVCSGDM